jgi:deoxyribose-phosphate aldolase
VAVKETLGDAWLTPSRYRFGASALLNDLVRQLIKQDTGAYAASHRISETTGDY